MKFAASKLLGLAFVLSTATHPAAAQKVHELLPAAHTEAALLMGPQACRMLTSK